MTGSDEVVIVDVPAGERESLERILEESFEGWYLAHSIRTLRGIESVRAAESVGDPLGLVMVKQIEQGVGYVFYIAVARLHRRAGIARLLLNDALSRFETEGVREVFASVESDNVPSEGLFSSLGFIRTSFVEVSRKYGALRAMNMYRIMVVVPGEILLHRVIGEPS